VSNAPAVVADVISLMLVVFVGRPVVNWRPVWDPEGRLLVGHGIAIGPVGLAIPGASGVLTVPAERADDLVGGRHAPDVLRFGRQSQAIFTRVTAEASGLHIIYGGVHAIGLGAYWRYAIESHVVPREVCFRKRPALGPTRSGRGPHQSYPIALDQPRPPAAIVHAGQQDG